MVQKISWVLVIVGAINWGLTGLGMLMGGDWNVVHMLLGSMASVEAVVYVLVGVAGILSLIPAKKPMMGGTV